MSPFIVEGFFVVVLIVLWWLLWLHWSIFGSNVLLKYVLYISVIIFGDINA